jgi:omega-6 fatty acid desaturase (delta-12 desaturase)
MPPLTENKVKEGDNLYPFNDLNDRVFTDEGRREYEKNYVPPSFTIKELRDSIPPHLFKKSLLWSSLYTIFDIIVVSILFASALQIRNLPTILQPISWITYWLIQGVFMTGIWVIAHECGHQAFCDSKTINNAVGFVLHTSLLVPYHPWRISHAKHHASTGHIDEDQVFVPFKQTPENPKVAAYSAWEEAWDTAPIRPLYNVLGMLIVGWPGYLSFNASGQNYGRHTSHFHTTSPIFKPEQSRQVVASDIGLVVVFAILGYFTYTCGFKQVMAYYGIPYFFVNAWLVLITFLQHTDVYVPHYNPETWNFVRGALTTVDRDFGTFLNWALHHINDSHVAHHLFSQMPHYNALEATKYLKEKLGPYYLKDNTNFLYSLYRSAKECQYVDATKDVMFYRRINWDELKKQD